MQILRNMDLKKRKEVAGVASFLITVRENFIRKVFSHQITLQQLEAISKVKCRESYKTSIISSPKFLLRLKRKIPAKDLFMVPLHKKLFSDVIYSKD